MATQSSKPGKPIVEKEIRFAVVMYGGVSLAIYINGVAQELFAMVRATAPDGGGEALFLADDELSGAERVYREIGQRLSAEKRWEREAPDDAPVRTRFVVDILSGAS